MTVEEFKSIEPCFDEALFLGKVNAIFINLFTSIMLDTLEDVQHLVSDSVYQFANNILLFAKLQGYRQMYDELNIKNSSIKEILVNQNVYCIKVFLQSRYMNYIINLSNGDFVSGNNKTRENFSYSLLLTKKKETKNQGTIRKCPGCGASLSTNTSGICPYCNNIYNQSDYDWILEEIEVLN